MAIPLLHVYSDTLETEHFPVPSGIAGTAFVHELSHLFSAYATGSVLEPVALRAAMTICALLLQKLSFLSKSKDHISCLERRIEPWRARDLYELLQEGRTIQHRLINSKRKSCSKAERLVRTSSRRCQKVTPRLSFAYSPKTTEVQS